MMLIATGLAAALFAAASIIPGAHEIPAASMPAPAPPLLVTVFWQPAPHAFELDPSQRLQIAGRIGGESLLVSR